MSLLELQRRFYTSVTSEGADLETGWPVEIRPGLAVYRHAYRARLIDCLRESFEKTWSWIGDDAFDAAALQHLSEHPPRSWTLDDTARDFTATLAKKQR